MKTLTRIAAAAALMTVTAAWADTVTTSFNPQFNIGDNITAPFAALPPSATGALDRFDASLGTLTGAHLSLYGAYTSWFTLVSTNGQEQTVPVDTSVRLDLSSSLAALDPLLVDLDDTASLFMTTDPFAQYFGGGNVGGGGPAPVELDLSGLLGALTGTGTFSITCTTTASGTFTATNVQLNVNRGADCGATLTYTYTPNVVDPGTVPEPGALALAGLALAGVAAATRRHRA